MTRILNDCLRFLPFLLLVALNAKTNLKRPVRSRQFLMLPLALAWCAVLAVTMTKVQSLLTRAIEQIPALLERLAGLLESRLPQAAAWFQQLTAQAEQLLQRIDLGDWMLVIASTAAMAAYVAFKRVVTLVLKKSFRPGNLVHDLMAGLFYECDEREQDSWYLKAHFGQARTYMRTFYLAAIAVSMAVAVVSAQLCRAGLLSVPFYPIFGIIVVGELYFYVDGLTQKELHDQISGEDDDARDAGNLAILRKYLRRVFGDKLTAEDTSISSEFRAATSDELLGEMERSSDSRVQSYGVYMRGRLNAGHILDQNYLHSGLELLQGKSILFNDPFYYDLIPYAFYAMDRTLLRHKKVLVILGRHGTEGDIACWCREGLRSISNIPDMWRVGQLGESQQELDVGIVTRSDVHNLELHKANRPFFQQVEFIVLIEPSRLITTAQVGLNSLIHDCSAPGKTITCCSTDKNCDGLVDALSHVLMMSISEVSATDRHDGTCSYMCWSADTEHLQHRLLPNLSRYLGMGTELSFAALKNQVSTTRWYGGDAFPVTDMHWIVKQYYYDLLNFARLPANQETIDRAFIVSPNLWDVRRHRSSYLTIEDEACNMFEVKRDFSTRAEKQSFINVISPAYLLRDYMADNESVFDADPKAIPYIVADYARTRRNVMFRLCLRMSSGELRREDLERELMLVDVDACALTDALWSEICTCFRPVGAPPQIVDGAEVLTRTMDGKTFTFERKAIGMRRKYSIALGRMEELYCITDLHFRRVLLDDLQNANCIAEEEGGRGYFLGAELRGHIFQKYLPGQFLVFSGKYYQMLSVTADHQVLVRRAADHITGRPSYRQIRSYAIGHIVDSDAMGACQSVGAMRLTRQFANFTVKTSAYWEMPVYNDFANARKIAISGIPDRQYYNKQILRIDFPELGDRFTEEIRYTVTLLLNEVFRTLFAENQPYIAAVTLGEPSVPMTYGLTGEDGCMPDKDAIYIIEDSQLDIGLLVAVERSMDRVFSILCDYLDWHMEALHLSLDPPPVPPQPSYEVDGPVEKESWWRRLKERASAFFGKLFRRKPKKTIAPETQEQETHEIPVPESVHVPPVEEAPEEDLPLGGTPADGSPAMPAGDVPAEEGPSEDVPEEDLEDTPVGDMSEEDPWEGPSDEGQEDVLPGAQETDGETADTPDDTPEDGADGMGEIGDAQGTDEGTAQDDDGDRGPSILASIRRSSSTAPTGEDPSVEGPAVEETSVEGEAILAGSEVPAGETVEFEPERASKPRRTMERLPYHERYYLLYGGSTLPEKVAPAAVLAFLRELGYGDNSLEQARKGRKTADLIEQGLDPNGQERHFCDFCGVELVGTEYDVLSDGRERCPHCSHTAVRTAEEFEAIYHKAVEDLSTFFGADIRVPVKVSMVNAKRLHKKLGKSFVPTGKLDGRVLGVAIREGKDRYTILVENGSPRLASAMTIVHELTHIWQYNNWDQREIRQKYGAAQELEVYEGMAKWVEIQYAYLIGEPVTAKREEFNTRARDDEYGRGFMKYASLYPLSQRVYLTGETPFSDVHKPL